MNASSKTGAGKPKRTRGHKRGDDKEKVLGEMRAYASAMMEAMDEKESSQNQSTVEALICCAAQYVRDLSASTIKRNMTLTPAKTAPVGLRNSNDLFFVLQKDPAKVRYLRSLERAKKEFDKQKKRM